MLRLASILAASAVFVFSAAYPSTHQLAGCDRTPPEERNGIYYDADGLIVHRPTAEHPCGDGGDTAQREGWYWLGVWIRQNTPGLPAFVPDRRLTFQEVLALLEPNRDGVFYRHPKLSPWNNPHSKEFGFSRRSDGASDSRHGCLGHARRGATPLGRASRRRAWEAHL